MASSTDDLINFAKEIAGNPSEIHQRCSASRAYYASYHLCNGFAETRDIPHHYEEKTSYGFHEALIKRFTEFNQTSKEATNLKSVGYMLRQSRDIRVNADYRLTETFDSKDTKLAIGYFEKIFERLENSKI